VRALAEAGVYPGGSARNLEAVTPQLDVDTDDAVTVRILADAQTSGGLLLTVGPAARDGLMGALRDAGVAAAVIGEIVDGPAGRIRIRP
jgi:selenide,water dikinase